MKKLLFGALFLSALIVPPAFAASPKSDLSRFYGKVLTVHPESKRITVFSKKKKTEMNFVWTDQTKITKKKISIAANELTAGDNLVIAYAESGGEKVAKSISVRDYSFKKKIQN